LERQLSDCSFSGRICYNGVDETVYVETTVVSYLTARPARDLIFAARQEITRRWWRTASERFDLFISPFVIREAQAGDSGAAERRLKAIEEIPFLIPNKDAVALAQRLIHRAAIPLKAAEDAMHVAMAATHGMDYLVTWNFTHIANATMRDKIAYVIESTGFHCPVVCTPEELDER
jgi:hypothetical protein